MIRFAVFAVLAFGMIAVSCTQTPTRGVFVDPAFGPLVPSNADVLAGLRIDKIKETAIYKQYQDRFNVSSVDEFSQRTGLDPRRDIWSVLVVLTGKESLALARGKFTTGELEPRLDALGGERTSYKNYTIIGSERNAAVFINPGVAAAAAAPELRALIDRRNQNNGGIAEELKQRLESLPKSDQIFVVSRVGLPAYLFPSSAEVQSALANIVSFVSGATIGIGLDSGLHLTADINCVSEQGAKRVNDALRGGIGLARLSTKDNDAEMLRVYDSIHVEQQKDVVHGSADLSADSVGKLMTFLPKAGAMGRSAIKRLEH